VNPALGDTLVNAQDYLTYPFEQQLDSSQAQIMKLALEV
jgi:hypothetical protein